MLRLYTAGDLPEAHLVVQLLEHAGIAAQVFNEHAQGGLGEIPFTHTHAVMLANSPFPSNA